jgi:hypothetical protein
LRAYMRREPKDFLKGRDQGAAAPPPTPCRPGEGHLARARSKRSSFASSAGRGPRGQFAPSDLRAPAGRDTRARPRCTRSNAANSKRSTSTRGRREGSPATSPFPTMDSSGGAAGHPARPRRVTDSRPDVGDQRQFVDSDTPDFGRLGERQRPAMSGCAARIAAIQWPE